MRNGLRRAGSPCAIGNGYAIHHNAFFDILQWFLAAVVAYLEQSYVGEIGGGDFCIRIADSGVGVRYRSQGHFHVGLARSDPDFPEQNVCQLDRVLAGKGNGMRRTGVSSWYRYFPVARTICHSLVASFEPVAIYGY